MFHNMDMTTSYSWSVLIDFPILYGFNPYFLVIVTTFALKLGKEAYDKKVCHLLYLFKTYILGHETNKNSSSGF